MTGPQSEGWRRDHGRVIPTRLGKRSRGMARQQPEKWGNRACTPETRAEIRRWSQWEAVSFWVLATGGICALALPVIGLGLAVWSMIDDDVPWLWWFFAFLGVTMLLLLVGGALGSVANGRRLTALYADGQVSVGRLDEVITHPGDGDDQTTYDFLISAGTPGEVTLHRKLYWGEEDGWVSPERWAGRAIRFRLNTLDPDDLHDVLFIELAEADKAAGS